MVLHLTGTASEELGPPKERMAEIAFTRDLPQAGNRWRGQEQADRAALGDCTGSQRGKGECRSSRPGHGARWAGKLTDLHSAPLAGVTLVLRNAVTGAEARTTTAKNGLYRFDRLDAGEYTIEAESAQLGRSELDGIVVGCGT